MKKKAEGNGGARSAHRRRDPPAIDHVARRHLGAKPSLKRTPRGRSRDRPNRRLGTGKNKLSFNKRRAAMLNIREKVGTVRSATARGLDCAPARTRLASRRPQAAAVAIAGASRHPPPTARPLTGGRALLPSGLMAPKPPLPAANATVQQVSLAVCRHALGPRPNGTDAHPRIRHRVGIGSILV